MDLLCIRGKQLGVANFLVVYARVCIAVVSCGSTAVACNVLPAHIYCLSSGGRWGHLCQGAPAPKEGVEGALSQVPD